MFFYCVQYESVCLARSCDVAYIKTENICKTPSKEKRYSDSGIYEKGLSRGHNVKATNFPGCTSDKTVQKLDNLINDKLGDFIIHIGNNDLMNNVKFLNNVKRISKKVSTNATPANLAFSSITVRKVKRNIEKSTPDTNVRLKNFYMQEGIGFINNNSIKEDFLWKSKLYSRKRGNSYQQLQIIF